MPGRTVMGTGIGGISTNGPSPKPKAQTVRADKKGNKPTSKNPRLTAVPQEGLTQESTKYVGRPARSLTLG